jgi:hypothetical protein
VVEGLFLDGIGRQGGDGAVDQGHELAAVVAPRAAPAQRARLDLTATLAGQAAYPPPGRLLEQDGHDGLGVSPREQFNHGFAVHLVQLPTSLSGFNLSVNSAQSWLHCKPESGSVVKALAALVSRFVVTALALLVSGFVVTALAVPVSRSVVTALALLVSGFVVTALAVLVSLSSG